MNDHLAGWRLQRVKGLIPLALWVIALALPFLGMSPINQRQILTIAIYAMVVTGLNLSFGFAGELALGQVAIMAVGAYTTAILARAGVTDIFALVAATLMVSAIIGLLTGIPSLRLSQWALGLISFFLVLLLPGVLVATQSFSGGLNGLTLPRSTLFGSALDTPEELYILGIAVLGVWMFIFRNLILSRYGTALRAISRSPVLAESLGVRAKRMKLSAYVVGSLPAGVAGSLYALQAGFISPSPFSLGLMIEIIAACVIAGATSIYGGIFGAAVLQLVVTQSEAFASYSIAVFGALLLISGAVFRKGVAGVLARVSQRVAGRFRVAPAGAPAGVELDLRMPGATLAASDVSKAFGGVLALRDASVRAEPGQVTAIIGSNGAGKTTLLNVISGFISPDTGRVTVDGAVVTGQPGFAIARAGVARAFQTPEIPESMTVLDVVRSGSMRSGSLKIVPALLRTPAYRRQAAAERSFARALLDVAGLGGLASREATTLPLGSRRLLEVLRAAMSRPKVLLLDEPAAGLDDDSLGALGALIRTLRDEGSTIVLVEHNVPFVMEVSDVVWAMDLGTTITSGTPADVAADPRVIDAYLGRERAGGHQ